MKAPRILQMITLRGHSFLPSLLSRDSVVIDLGAHAGEFSRQITSRFGCRCVAVEANPALMGLVEATPGVEAVWSAISGDDQPIKLRIAANPEASTVVERRGGDRREAPTAVLEDRADRDEGFVEVHGCRLETLLADRGISHVGLLKVDIEGAEVAMFRSTPDAVLGKIDQISVEFHDFCGLVTEDELDEVVTRLAGVGFDGFRFGSDNMNWLFLRRAVVPTARRLYVKHMVRPLRNTLHWGRALIGAHRLGLSQE